MAKQQGVPVVCLTLFIPAPSEHLGGALRTTPHGAVLGTFYLGQELTPEEGGGLVDEDKATIYVTEGYAGHITGTAAWQRDPPVTFTTPLKVPVARLKTT